MTIEACKKRVLLAAGGLIALSLSWTSVRADHDADLVTPLVTIFAVGALLNYSHSSQHYHHYYRYKRRSYAGHGHYHGGNHGQGHYQGHYRGHYKRSHSSHGQYARKPRHSSSRGGHYSPRRKP